MIRKAMEKLLPNGFIWKDETLNDFCKSLCREFSRVAGFIEGLAAQIPGRLQEQISIRDTKQLRAYLKDWEEFLGLPDECTQHDFTETERNQDILARLGESGGQSLASLTAVVRNAARSDDIIVRNSCRPLEIEVIGLEMTPIPITCRSAFHAPLLEVTRQEHVIHQLERVKHAHLDSRYFDKERTIYAPD